MVKNRKMIMEKRKGKSDNGGEKKMVMEKKLIMKKMVIKKMKKSD